MQFYFKGETMMKAKLINLSLEEKIRFLVSNEKNTLGSLEKYVFPKITNQNLNRELKKIAKLAKIDKNVTCHVGRHTFASNLSNMRKISLPIISKLLGHKNIANTSIYTNSNLNVMKESLKDFRYEIKH